MKIDRKTKYLAFGLIGLLFVITIVHSVAILEISDETEQEAQLTALSAGCLQVTPLHNAVEAFGPGSIGPLPGIDYKMFFSVKNTCTYGVKVVNPQTYSGQTAAPMPQLLVTSIQRRDGFGNGVDLPVPTNYLDTQALVEGLSCSDCNGGVATYHTSPVGGWFHGGTYNNLGAYSIAPGATKQVSMQIAIGINPLGLSTHYRIRPAKMLWFSDAALADSNVSVTEIKSHSFSSANSLNWATDYARYH